MWAISITVSLLVLLTWLQYLPVLVFNPSKEFEPKDSAISSIYYDNPETWELYQGRLKKTEGAEAIRLRWYGGMDTDNIFVERKTHREDWTGEKSVKARFSLKEKNVNDFLSGRMTTEKVFEKMRRDGKKGEKEINDLEQLAKEIQFRVLTRKLCPVTRSFYNRTAFQLPGDARVRISLDTELTMTREDNLDDRDRAGRNWRRTDIGIDYPFSQLPPEDVDRFPYAVLEVKLQTQAGQEPPQWIRDLTSSHLAEAVPKFSKFIHGTAALNPTRIHLLPFWMPQMDIDIRKPVSHHFGIEHPNQSTDASTSANLDDDDDYSDDEDEVALKHQAADLPEDNENLQRLRAARDAMEQHELDRRRNERDSGAETQPNALDIEERISSQPQVLDYGQEDYPPYESSEEDDNDIEDEERDTFEEAKRIGGLTYQRALLTLYLRKFGRATGSILLSIARAPLPKPTPVPNRQSAMGIPRGSNLRKRFKAPPGKRIHVPVRVEPKVFFAAERTFLAWLEFAIILGSIAATLLNFGDAVSVASAVGFTLVAGVSLIYSFGLYMWRVRKIRMRRAGSYHDGLGPSVLCVGLVACVGVSLWTRLRGGFDTPLRG